MPDSPTLSDDALLTRLNALKKSSISFDTQYSSSIAPPPASNSTRPSDDLAARFARLGSASPSSSPKPSGTASSKNTRDETSNGDGDSAPTIAPGASSYFEGVAEGIGGSGVEFNAEDEKTLEELLGELHGDRKNYDISRKDEHDVGKLLKDIRTVLPEVQKSAATNKAQEIRRQDPRGEVAKTEELTDWENIEVNIGPSGVEVGREDQRSEGCKGEGEEEKKKTEDEEVDDVVARVMAELEIRKKYDHPSPSSEDENSDSGDQTEQKQRHPDSKIPPTTDQEEEASGFSLPSAPTSIPEDDLAHTQAIEDALTARLAALSSPSPSQSDSLGLPSAPSFSPLKKPPKIQASLQKRLDDEIDTWCIICSDDATLKCLGCDGDLYCQNCWMEGHRGESAGFEERRHRAVLFSKKKKEAATG